MITRKPDLLCTIIGTAILFCACSSSKNTTDVDGGTDAGEVLLTPGDQVESFFGEAPDKETRLLIFDTMWEDFRMHYAGFGPSPVDWYDVRDEYRPAVEQATSYGEFFHILSKIFIALQDGHTVIGSDKVCDTPLAERPPYFVHSDWSSVIGACVTALADDTLLVYRVNPDNPAGLAPGDVVVGYDGTPWRDLLDKIDEWKLPICGRPASADLAEDHIRMNSVMNNAHLFDEMNIRRLGVDTVDSVATDTLLAYSSTTLCTEQIEMESVGFPCTDWDVCLDVGYHGNYNASWGILPGTNIGYIYLFSWLPNVGPDFTTAVSEFMNTDGLIIDQRFNFGGKSSGSDKAIAMLFEEDVNDVMNCARRDDESEDITALDINPGRWRDLEADPETFYDRPIAVLQGPHAISAGDMVPHYLGFHPRARRFGLMTNGTFGGSHGYWVPDPIISDLTIGMSTVICVGGDGEYLQGASLNPEQEVWLTQDDVAAGVDTVVEAALDWIAEENMIN